MIYPLPYVSLAYSLLIQDEKQREVCVPSDHAGGNSSYLVVDGNGSLQYHRHGNRLQTNEYKSKKGNSSLICSHCKKVGHYVDKCYRIIGFPNDFKFTKTKRNPNAIRSNVMIPSELPCFPSSLPNFVGNAGNQLTQEQDSQLIHQLSQPNVNQPDDNVAGQSAIATYVGNPFSLMLTLHQF